MSVDNSMDGGVGMDMLGHSTAAPMSGQDSAHKHRNSDVTGVGFSSVGQSTDKGGLGSTTLPEVHPNSSKAAAANAGYQTH